MKRILLSLIMVGCSYGLFAQSFAIGARFNNSMLFLGEPEGAMYGLGTIWNFDFGVGRDANFKVGLEFGYMAHFKTYDITVPYTDPNTNETSENSYEYLTALGHTSIRANFAYYFYQRRSDWTPYASMGAGLNIGAYSATPNFLSGNFFNSGNDDPGPIVSPIAWAGFTLTPRAGIDYAVNEKWSVGAHFGFNLMSLKVPDWDNIQGDDFMGYTVNGKSKVAIATDLGFHAYYTFAKKRGRRR